ncbi:MAG: tetratricopeptide repeat protein [Aromatoleum sp.]|nr:tetratricopeptide repeat protein [Aromatoleum sp.]
MPNTLAPDRAETTTLPKGTVTFLFTDIEGSTRLWESERAAMRVALARHDAILRQSIGQHGGHVFKTGGDSFCAAFDSTADAAVAALSAQRALKAEPWPETARLLVRMALHTGVAEMRDADYFGPTLNKVARLMAVAHGGQTLLSDITHELCEDELPDNATLKPLGEFSLKDLAKREAIFQLSHPDLRDEFPPLRTAVVVPVDDTTPSIAVMPFVNMSQDKENEYFADGLSEELLNVLVKIRGLRVASRTSAFSFKGKDVDIPTLAQKLNVANILEGSVRRSGKRVRVTAQLINAAIDSHLWSETYDRDFDDIFAVQDDIAQTVVKELRRTLLKEAPAANENTQVKAEVAAAAKGRSQNAEAYQLYLRAQYFREQLTRDGAEQAIQSYLQAIALDPGYALAWAGLSRAYGDQAGQHWVSFADGFGRARAAAERAIAREPELAEAHAALGWVKRAFDWDWKGAEASFQRALELAPGSTLVMNAHANLLGTLGRLDEAIELSRKATALDPLNVPVHRNLALFCLGAGRWEEADAVLKKVLQMSPQGGLTRCWLGVLALGQERPEEALEQMHLEVNEIFRLVGLAIAHHAVGNWAESEAALAEFIDKHGRDSPYQVAEIYGACGDPDKMFDWLERTYAERDPGLSYLRMDPFIRDDVRDDPRWQAFLVKMALAG